MKHHRIRIQDSTKKHLYDNEYAVLEIPYGEGRPIKTERKKFLNEEYL